MTLRALFATALAASLAGCSSSALPPPRAAFAEPVFTTVEAASYPGVEYLKELLVGDVNGDGRPDALVGYYDAVAGRSSYSPYLNDGGGSFRAGDPVHHLRDARLTDLDRDGRNDLVGCGNSGPRVLLGRSDGPAWVDVPMPPSSSCEEVAVGDFDGDGRTDFAFGMRGPGSGLTRFAVLRGNGDGTFQPMGSVQGIDGLRDDRPGFFRMVPGNFNADARTDLAILFSTGPEGYRPEIRVSHGDGTFSRSWPQDGYPEEFTRRSVIAEFLADLDGDGRADLLLWAQGYELPIGPPGFPGPPGEPLPRPIMFAMLGRGDGTLAPPSASMDGAVAELAVGDIDRDNRPDLLHWQFVANEPVRLYAAFGRGDGTFLDPVVVATPATHVSGLTRIVDMNGDGRVDLLALSGSRLAVLLAKP